MREVAEKFFKGRNNVHSVNACAEHTNLTTGSIDVISIGQALHWFDLKKAKNEFLRILKKPGFALVVGKGPTFTDKNLAEEIDALTQQFCYKKDKRIDFDEICHDEIFTPFKAETITIVRRIKETVSQIIHGTLSCSFSPDEGHKDFPVFVETMKSILLKYAFHNMIEVDIKTKMTYGRMK
jgi:ubiquinone/menaquinone biosynthesis C-methylase UbiE